MLTFKAGDSVEYKSLCSAHVWRGIIVGFCFKSRDVAICTDETGLPPRPVSIDRLRPGRSDLAQYFTGPGAWSPMP